MTAPAPLLDRLRAAGATVRLVGGRPRIHAPVALPPDLLAEARANREALIEALAPPAANDRAPIAQDAAGPVVPCARCGGGAWWRASGYAGAAGPGSWVCSRCWPAPAGTWVDACALPEAPR